MVATRLKGLERENARPKKIVAGQLLDIDILKEPKGELVSRHRKRKGGNRFCQTRGAAQGQANRQQAVAVSGWLTPARDGFCPKEHTGVLA
jgi:hypothetical protein